MRVYVSRELCLASKPFTFFRFNRNYGSVSTESIVSTETTAGIETMVSIESAVSIESIVRLMWVALGKNTLKSA